MLTIRYQTDFKKDYKRIVRRGYDCLLYTSARHTLELSDVVCDQDHIFRSGVRGDQHILLYNAASVSYTHLDVYKRQIQRVRYSGRCT